MEENGSQKSSLTGIAAGLGRLTPEKRRAALEVSAALAGVSLRASREFVAAVPAAGDVLTAEDIKLWGELGRRLAMGNAETGAKFFTDGVEDLREVPEEARRLVFQICTRQLVLSSSIAQFSFGFVFCTSMNTWT